jgi:hypothetical protein
MWHSWDEENGAIVFLPPWLGGGSAWPMSNIIDIVQTDDGYVINAAIVRFMFEGDRVYNEHGDIDRIENTRSYTVTTYSRYTFGKNPYSRFYIRSIEEVSGLEETGWLKKANEFYELAFKQREPERVDSIDIVIIDEYTFVARFNDFSWPAVSESFILELRTQNVTQVKNCFIENYESHRLWYGHNGLLHDGVYWFFKQHF